MNDSALRPDRQPDVRPDVVSAASVEVLARRIDELVRERQELRRGGARNGVLERNRLELAQLQRELSRALIDRHLPPAA
ncbi:MAG TPA: hypothetical protein VF101_18535 [Gaiellaceae bacterium]